MAVALPQPLAVGVEASCQGSERICREDLKFYGTVGFFRWPITVAERSLSAFTLESGARYYPFKFPLYVSAGFGFRQLRLTTDVSSFTIEGESLATSGSLNLSTVYFTPTVGWTFSLSKDLFLGMEVGAQLPLIASGDLYLQDSATGANSDTSDTLKTNSATAMSRIARLPIPKFTLIRLTWYFH